STALSKAFAKQGIKIPIRKETRYRKITNEDSHQPSEEVPETTSSSLGTHVTTNEDPNATESFNDNNEACDRSEPSDDADVLSSTSREEESEDKLTSKQSCEPE
ncbi:33634_t:CDS:1, partial [Racocetra persica]